MGKSCLSHVKYPILISENRLPVLSRTILYRMYTAVYGIQNLRTRVSRSILSIRPRSTPQLDPDPLRDPCTSTSKFLVKTRSFQKQKKKKKTSTPRTTVVAFIVRTNPDYNTRVQEFTNRFTIHAPLRSPH